ncbi:hypothetical protein BGW38_010811 [Lunasporangiospora selenospora]|uniref:Diphthine--ammonia ligase n=1 Tax=Lunasporangiospora selenospora TaxID=979761 RepID=A0A9P6KIB1_9FUNG|nr:hypothetical protein BGW38_010811 [Lunasporangiospora selenospora]
MSVASSPSLSSSDKSSDSGHSHDDVDHDSSFTLDESDCDCDCTESRRRFEGKGSTSPWGPFPQHESKTSSTTATANGQAGTLEYRSKIVFEEPGWIDRHLALSRIMATPPPPTQVSIAISVANGGKDSFYNLMQCVANGHTVIALANLRPPLEAKKDEIDSYMYQTVGHDVIHLYKDCMDLPLYRRDITGGPIQQGNDYTITAKDETEDLFELLQQVKEAHPDLEAVSVGAILSSYQRIRVENVCGRLGLVALSYLWQRNQEELLYEMAQAGVNAVLIKIAAIGLKKQHLSQSIGDMYPHLCRMNQEYDLHICGEGGEYETLTLDCPLFRRRIVVDESEVVIHSDDHFAQVAYLRFKQLHLEDKAEDEVDPNWVADVNLDPVWDADSIMPPVEEVVQSRQIRGLQESEEKALNIPKSSGLAGEDSEIIGAHPSKFNVHQGNITCAIGGTTAYDEDGHRDKKHMSIVEETRTCLLNVQAKLEKLELSWSEVVFMQVFVSNMSDFGVVNGAYKRFFGINPPPRACVGANLAKPCRIQVNCIAIHKEAIVPKPRQTLHVQGMSYWAPANIGPYSQATEQAYHSFIAGQIGMVPSTLNIPQPPSLAKETAWSLRNLLQIATVRNSDLINRTALCIAYVNSPDHFDPVRAAWSHITNKKTSAPVLAICVPSLPKGAQVEWQALLHHGKVYSDRTLRSEGQDGYDTDDDDQYQLEKRALQPTTMTLFHEQAPSETASNQEQSGATSKANSLLWKTKTESWFLSPVLSALSVLFLDKGTDQNSSLTALLSSLHVTQRSSDRGLDQGLSIDGPSRDSTIRDMSAMMIQAMDRILDHHIVREKGPGVKCWSDVVAMTLYYDEGVLATQGEVSVLKTTFEQLLSGLVRGHMESLNIALTYVPVQAIADGGLLALTLHAVGKMPTVPGLHQS